VYVSFEPLFACRAVMGAGILLVGGKGTYHCDERYRRLGDEEIVVGVGWCCELVIALLDAGDALDAL
jgi:hypothetical protein